MNFIVLNQEHDQDKWYYKIYKGGEHIINHLHPSFPPLKLKLLVISNRSSLECKQCHLGAENQD